MNNGYELYNGSGLYNSNAFFTMLNPEGSALIYSTYLGGTPVFNFGDGANAIALDKFGDVYITGSSGSDNLPVTRNAFQGENKGAGSPNFAINAFVSRFAIERRHHRWPFACEDAACE